MWTHRRNLLVIFMFGSINQDHQTKVDIIAMGTDWAKHKKRSSVFFHQFWTNKLTVCFSQDSGCLDDMCVSLLSYVQQGYVSSVLCYLYFSSVLSYPKNADCCGGGSPDSWPGDIIGMLSRRQEVSAASDMIRRQRTRGPVCNWTSWDNNTLRPIIIPRYKYAEH